MLADIRTEGHVSLQAVAAELNLKEMKSRRGGAWSVSSVRNLVGRLPSAFVDKGGEPTFEMKAPNGLFGPKAQMAY